MTIQTYKDLLNDESTKTLTRKLEVVLGKIHLLESIYMTDGENHHFSDTFHNVAYEERQEYCKYSSALYSLLRDRGVATNVK